MLSPRELQAVLAWSALPWVGERTLGLLLAHAREGRVSLAELWEMPLRDLTALVPLHARTVAALERDPAARWSRAALDAETVRSWGADLLLAGDAEFPEDLSVQRTAPRKWSSLFAYGALGLLDEPRVALVSSRTVTNSGLAVTDALADSLARRDVVMVTSPNREAYQTAAVAAKRHAGPAIMALDRGMTAMFPDGLEREPVAAARVWDDAFDPDIQLLLSPFGWSEPWNPRSGPRRDALIFDLASVVVAVDVQVGGNVERELHAALAKGRSVVVLDRGGDTATGNEVLLREIGVTALPWRGADHAAEAVLAQLPASPQDSGRRQRDGWLREVYRLMPRLCERFRPEESRSRVRPTLGVYPAALQTATLGRTVAAWSQSEPDGARPECLVADLSSGGPATRVGQLLTRVKSGGLLVALVPGAWLEEQEMERARTSWAGDAQCRLIVQLPLPDATGDRLGLVVLEASGGLPGSRSPALLFTPRRKVMAGFHLRRYFEEILSGCWER